MNADNNEEGSAKAMIALLRGLRQSREFAARSVPREMIDDILEVARWSGSGMNQQPWDLILVRDHNTLKQMAAEEGAGSHLARADFGIVIAITGESNAIKTFDEGRLTERLMLAAAAHGLGAGIHWFKDGGAAARRILGVPPDRFLRTAISFGYPAEGAASRPKRKDARKPITELVHEERY